MKIFLVDRTGRIDYDECGAVVVVAENASRAVWRLREGPPGIEGPDAWASDQVGVTFLGEADDTLDAGIILADVVVTGRRR